uniref:5'-3' exoribonuclease 1 n=1 Tax=Ornithodoros turicata TaxID=34597 RepID=A0A2R5LDG2_9ACAR
MGVPKFYRWISERYPCLSTVVREYQIPEFDNLYLDMNGIIHVCSHPNDGDPHFRITEEKIFADIFNYLEFLFRMIKPRKTFFMAIDGVAPRAKMNQQRGRRFRSAREAELLEKQAKERGEVLPTEARFDSNCISPGTEFMARLNEQLKYFVTMKMSTDPLWQKVEVYLSGHETPGEGEHKVMDFIRTQRSKPDYDPNTRHCLYGLDADLIILGSCSHEPHFALLREEIVYGKKEDKRRLNVPEEITFHLLHISLLREYLAFEFSPVREKIPFEWNLEGIVDDWVLMCFLVGNDFIPHLPHMHIANNALPTLYRTYMDVLPTLEGYINEQGTLNLERFEKFLKKLAEFDYETFTDTHADRKFLESKRAENGENGVVNHDISADSKKERDPDETRLLEKFAHLDIPDVDSEEEDLFEMEFRQHKRDYYVNKLDYSQVTPDVLQEQAHGYVRAIQWNLHYYYHGVPSWNWFYPHHYSPYISDIKDFKGINMDFDLGKPFLPFQQLMSIMPTASKKLVPNAYQSLMESEDSPIVDYYPREFSTDLNGKQQEWEAVVLIPFIDETRLLPAMAEHDPSLTEEERKRNVHSGHLLFTYSPEPLGRYVSTEPAFPDVEFNHARMKEIGKDRFHLPKDRIKLGLLKGVNHDTYYPGFPTFKHLEHTAKLKKASVKVFQALSRNENMLVSIVVREEKSIDKLAAGLLGKIVLVEWPHLLEAKVVSIADGDVKYSLDRKGERMFCDLTESEVDIFGKEVESITDRYQSRFGVLVGPVNVLVYCKPMTGRKYVFGLRGRITLERQWAQHNVPFALQTIVQDIPTYAPDIQEFKTIEEVFPQGKLCFMIGFPHYGCQGEVVDSKLQRKQGRILIKFAIQKEPDIERVKRNEKNLSTLHFMTAYQLGQKLGVSALFVSRITGTVFVQMNSREAETASLVNVGLNLKFNKSNEEVPGYSKKMNEGWLYSNKCYDVVKEYLEKFTEFIEKIQSRMDRDKINVEDIFPDGAGADEVREVAKWIKGQGCSQMGRMKCGSEMLDEGVIKAIEETVDELQSQQGTEKSVVIEVLPKSLYQSEMCMGNIKPDPSTSYRLYDRVVNVREGITVPLGLRGTITGISKTATDSFTLYNVVFDKNFVGGLSLMCSPGRGYRMPEASLVNLSHGARINRGQQIYEIPARREAPFVLTRQPRQPPPVEPWSQRSGEEGPHGFPKQESPRMNKFHHSPNSPFELQKVRKEPPLPVQENHVSGKSDFTSLWQGLQKASNEVHDQYKNAEVATSSSIQSAHQGVRVSLDELFRGAAQASKTSDLSSSLSNAETLLAQYVREHMGLEPEYSYTAQAHKKVQAIITLPNGKKFFSQVLKDRRAAAQDAAQQALNILTKDSKHSRTPHSMPTTVPAQRPFMPPPFSSQALHSLGPAPGSLTLTRMPPRSSAALIPDSFVESNQQLLQSLENSAPAERSHPVSWQTPRVPHSLVQPGIVSPQDQARMPFYWLPQAQELLSPSYFTQTTGVRSEHYGRQGHSPGYSGYAGTEFAQSAGGREMNRYGAPRQQHRMWRRKEPAPQQSSTNQFVPMQVLRNQPTTPKSSATAAHAHKRKDKDEPNKKDKAESVTNVFQDQATPPETEALKKGTPEAADPTKIPCSEHCQIQETRTPSVPTDRTHDSSRTSRQRRSRLAVKFNSQPSGQ